MQLLEEEGGGSFLCADMQKSLVRIVKFNCKKYNSIYVCGYILLYAFT